MAHSETDHALRRNSPRGLAKSTKWSCPPQIGLALCLLLLLSSLGCTRFQDNGFTCRLYFGLSSPQGQISDEQFQEFLDREITSRFPDGLTVYDAQGQWKSESGRIIQEKARVVEIIGFGDTTDYEKIRELRDLYKKKFHQESVLQVRHRSRVEF